MTSIGVGIVGAGMIGRKRMEACAPTFSVCSLFDIDRDRALDLAALAPGASVAASIDELLSRDDVDLVIVATTHDQLTPVALQVVAAGKSVLVEKPAALSAAELATLHNAAQEAGVIARVGYNHRFHPSVLRAKSLVADGGYGPLLWIRGRYGHGGRVGYEQEWRADRAISGGGELIDQGSHLIDLVRFMVGDVKLAFAELSTLFWPMAVEDNAFMGLHPESGGFAWLHASWSEWKNLFSFEITLERAKIEITGLGGSYGVERLTLYEMSPEMGPPATTSWEWPFADRSWSEEMDDVASAFEGREGVGANVADGVAVLEVIDHAYAMASVAREQKQ